MAIAALNGFGVFGDEVFTSTDLNRRSGEVLNRAREHPITISRNNEQFALLRRDQAAKLVQTATNICESLELLTSVQLVIKGQNPALSHSWLKVFDKDDLQRLADEVLTVSRDAAVGSCDWKNVAAVIHEWQESASVATHGVLHAAMRAEPSDESPLPHPDEVLSTKEDEPDLECASR